jgi:hypothetical protein
MMRPLRFDKRATRAWTRTARPAGVSIRPSECESIPLPPKSPLKAGTILAEREAMMRPLRFDKRATRAWTRIARPAGVSIRPSACESIPLPPKCPLKAGTILAEREAMMRPLRFDKRATRAWTRTARPAGVSIRASECESIPLPPTSPLKAGTILAEREAMMRPLRFDKRATRAWTRTARPAGVSIRASECESIPLPQKQVVKPK